ncbi:MAG: GyrI-like domain-containing protein [Chitinophagaceae bacterium]
MIHLQKNILVCSVLVLFLFSCNNQQSSPKNTVPKDTAISKKQTAKAEPVVPAKKPPIINIVDTVAPKRLVIYMKDSASTYERINGKLARIYGTKLAECFKKNSLKITGAPMAWYTTQKAPYFFEAGIPVNKKPSKMPAGVFYREIPADSVVMAHFYGPYDLLHMGYDALKEWLVDHKKRSTSRPYEIYVVDPMDKKGKLMDPYKIQTDIIFTRR